jgi:RNA polymerase sigma factor (sigma-70 family)
LFTTEIIEGCIANDRRSQRLLYEAVYPILIRVGYRYFKNEDEVMEVVTNSYLKIIKNIKQVNNAMQPEAWVHRIGVNTAIDVYRSKKTYQSNVKLEASFEEHAMDYMMVDTNSIDKELNSRHIVQMIQELPDLTREVLNLFAIDGFGHTEICEMLGISNEMSRWHLYKGRKIMAEKLEQFNNQQQKHTS